MGSKKNKSNFSGLLFVLNNKAFLLMILVLILSVVLTGGMSVTGYNIAGIMRQISVLAIISIGFTIILAGGQMDLSVGELVSLCGVCYGILAKILPIWLAIIIVILIGVFGEFLNGFMIRFFKIPGFVLTLAMGQVFKGVAHIISDGKSISGLGAAVKYLGQGQIFGIIPVPFVIMGVVVVIVAIILNKTIYGRHVIATGGNEQAAEVSGIRVGFIKTTALMIAGACFAVGAVVLTGRVATAIPTAGDGYLMDAIAAVVIGGTPMHGGKAKVVGTLFGVVLIGIINNMLNLLGVSPYWQWVFKGIIIIIAIIMDSFTDTILTRQREK